MDIALLIKNRLKELGLSQRDICTRSARDRIVHLTVVHDIKNFRRRRTGPDMYEDRTSTEIPARATCHTRRTATP